MIEPRTISQADAHRVLGQQVMRDAIAAKWITPRTRKMGIGGPAKVIYAVTDVRDVENRLLAGEYPGHPATEIAQLPKSWRPK